MFCIENYFNLYLNAMIATIVFTTADITYG